MSTRYDSLDQRFWSKVDVRGDNDCWEWLGAKTNGYGVLSKTPNEDERSAVANRICWKFCFGEIPEGLEIGHKCAKRDCVNPTHLYLCSRTENLQEMHIRHIPGVHPDTAEEFNLKDAMNKARIERGRWLVTHIGWDNVCNDQIIAILSILKDVQMEYKQIMIPLPSNEYMPCGHLSKYAHTSDEGTGFCLMCEFLALNMAMRKLALEKEQIIERVKFAIDK